jgi:hypothetical protein
MQQVNGISSALEQLVERGLSMGQISKLVGCSMVTLYRARKGRAILEVYQDRLSCVERFSDKSEEGSIPVLIKISSEYSEAAIWERGLYVIAAKLQEESIDERVT